MMKNTQIKKLERLQSVLVSFGADKSRWSSLDRELSAFIEEDAEAEKLYSEARALDQLLDLSALSSTNLSEDKSDLQQSILADFTEIHQAKAGVVVPFEGGKRSWNYTTANDNSWVTATALAACFALGIYLGGTGVGDWSLDLATSLAGLASEGDQFAEFADAAMTSSFEEDLL